MAYVLDFANILGGLLRAVPLLRRLPAIGYDVGKFAGRVRRWGWVVGIVALVAGGYFLIVHIFSGPHIFHFEIVGIGVGVALAWDRLTKRGPLTPEGDGELSGAALLLCVFGLIAVAVGLQGLVTPN